MKMPPNAPFPPQPATISIPNIVVTSKIDGSIDIPATTPFYYAGYSGIWVFFTADLGVLTQALAPFGLAPASFQGVGLVNINFFSAVALYGQGFPGNPGAKGFNETEVNVVAYPVGKADVVPQLSIADFLAGADQTKLFGNYRFWVACDDPIAVAAGQQLFFENKFLTSYSYNVPALNNPGVATFDVTCNDPTDTSLFIYNLKADLSGLSSIPGNTSEWIDYSFVDSAQRVAGSRRNYFAMSDTYPLPGPGAVTLTYGTSTHPMVQTLQALIGTTPACAVQIYRSPTVIAEARPYWADL